MAKKKVDEAAEAKINNEYARKAGVKPMKEMPEFKNFGKPGAKKAPADNKKAPVKKTGKK